MSDIKKKITKADAHKILLILSLVIISIVFLPLTTASTDRKGVPSSISVLSPETQLSHLSPYLDIRVRYYVDNLDGISGDETWLDTNSGPLDGSIYVSDDNQWLNLARYASDHFPEFAYVSGNALKYDANGDGDLRDSGDFTLYDGVYIIDGNTGTIRLAYDVFSHIDPSYEDNTAGLNEGEVTVIKGSRYAITGLDEFGSGEIELGPAIAKKISDPKTTPGADSDNAVVIVENYKIYYDETNTGTGKLYFYENNFLLDTYTIPSTFNSAIRLNDAVDVGDFEDKYHIYLVNNNSAEDWITMTFVDKDQTIDLVDEDEGVMGYDLVWVNNSNWPDNLVLLSPVVQLENGTIIDLDNTYYSLEFENESMLDIKMKVIKTQANGAKWKSSKYSDFLNGTDIWISAVDGQVEIRYSKQDLNDKGEDDYWTNGSNWVPGGVIDNSGFTGNLNIGTLKLSIYQGEVEPDYVFIGGKGLKYDANKDGDLEDTSDYTIYDGVWIIDGDGGTIRMGYNLGAHLDPDYGNEDTVFQIGEVVDIKGTKYAFTKVNKLSSGEVQIGSAITKKITDTGALDPDRAVVVAENFKIFYDQDSNAGTISFYEGNQLLDSYELSSGYPNATKTIKLNNEVSIGDFEDKYDIFLVKNSTADKRVYMTFVDKDNKVSLENEDEDVMGYDLVWVNNDNWPGNIVFFSSVISLVRDDTIDLPGTYYHLRWTMDKELDIKRKITVTQPDGSKWDKDVYRDFLKTDIWVDIYVIPPPPPVDYLVVDQNGTGNYTTIQDAIYAIDEGGTIFIKNGTYYERLYIPKSLRLIGESNERTVIHCYGGTCINVEYYKYNISIESLKITDGRYGILAYSGINISNSIFENNSVNIYAWTYYYGGTVIKNSQFYGGDVKLYGGNYYPAETLVSNNIFDGVYINMQMSYGIFENNTFLNPSSGAIDFYGSNNIIHGNNIQSGDWGIKISGSSNTVSNNVIRSENYEGIYLQNSDKNTIFNNTIINMTDNPDGYGIYLYYSNFNNITNNTLSLGYNDINLTRSYFNKVTDNIACDITSDSDPNTIENNTCNLNMTRYNEPADIIDFLSSKTTYSKGNLAEFKVELKTDNYGDYIVVVSGTESTSGDPLAGSSNLIDFHGKTTVPVYVTIPGNTQPGDYNMTAAVYELDTITGEIGTRIGLVSPAQVLMISVL